MPELTKADLKNNATANFKYVRLQWEMTVKEMAKHLGINEKTLGAIEEGRACTAHHVYKLSCLIKVSMDSIYKGLLNQ